jgi:hypothetical protein
MRPWVIFTLSILSLHKIVCQKLSRSLDVWADSDPRKGETEKLVKGGIDRRTSTSRCEGRYPTPSWLRAFTRRRLTECSLLRGGNAMPSA